MAKTQPKAATASGSRRDKLASFEAARKKEQRRRNIGMLVICLVLALALLAYPLYLFVDDYRASRASIGDLGVNVANAGCDSVKENAAKGNQEHVPEGTPVTYDQHPPDSGPHYESPAPFTKHFYTMDDRPSVETLVHNLEHGYTIAWYRDTMASSEVRQLQRISKTFASDAYNPEEKFIAAPWSESDGGKFPEGKNLVLTHWYADPAAPADPTKQKGIQQACSSVSGAAIKDFMAKYPYSNSPEPNGA